MENNSPKEAYYSFIVFYVYMIPNVTQRRHFLVTFEVSQPSVFIISSVDNYTLGGLRKREKKVTG